MKLAGALLTVYVVWGSTYLAMAVADRTLPPLLMLAVRFGIAGALLLAWAWRRGELAVRPGRRELRAAAVVGFALLVLDTGAVAWAVQRVPSGTAALLVASVPLFMAIVDRVWFGIRIPAAAAAGIATGLVGVAILARPSGHTDLLGAAALLVASLSWAAGSAYMRVAPLPRGPLASAALQMTAASVMLAVLGAATGEVGRVHPARISGESLAALAFLVLFGSLLAFTAYGWLVRHAPTPLVSTYAYVNPAVAVALGWALAGEHVGGREVAAGLVVLASVAMLLLAREATADPPATAESLPEYIRAQEARVDEVRRVPRLAELHRIAA
ncbi:MAG TPA: EamA family transporter [Gaiellaceae bacterium]|nr:EamA family transporter [Gaiellaceae bacterium]